MFKLFVVLATIRISTGQKITLFEYRQEDSETKCTNGLVSGLDTVVFKSQVDYSQDKAMKYAQFYIQRKMDPIPMLYDDLNIQDCVSGQKNTCELVGMFIINVSIKVTASNDYSGAVISAKLATSNSKETLSNKQVFPKIMDSRSTSGWLIVNGNTVSTNLTGCDLNVNDQVLNMTYVCDSDIKPCLIEITAASVDISSRGNDSATYILEQRPQDLNVIIKHASCSLDGEYNTLKCRIQKDETSSNVITVVIIIVSIVAVVAFIVVVLCIKYRKKVKSAVPKPGSKGPTSTDNLDTKEREAVLLLPQSPNNQSINVPEKLMDFTCDKNPGHHKFHALSDFKLEYVHKDYQDKKILKLIKGIADLSTRVCVKCASEQRSNAKKDGIGMDLNYLVEDMNAPRYKTGMVINAEKYSGDESKCTCEKCTENYKPSKSWGKVFVLTASTVVYDDSEAEKSSFDLFYDSNTSQFCTLHGRCVSEIDRSEGWCVVECVTCDLRLLDRLILMTNKCKEQMITVNRKYNTPEHQRTFTCIVSHPHGFPKHVTVGYWKDRVIVSKDQYHVHTRYQYITRTCPGSAGAFVYIIGVTDLSQNSYHVHISYEAERCNYCSIGVEKAAEIVKS